jgi:assimilatory nitrate reductase catalytic subunit
MTAGALSKTATHCPYCALQCGVLVDRGPADRPTGLALVGNRDFPVNAGALCIKGWTATEVVNHPDRLDGPLARDESGALVPVSWREALDRAAAALRRTQKQHGRDAVGVLGSGALTNEKAYLLGKSAGTR